MAYGQTFFLFFVGHYLIKNVHLEMNYGNNHRGRKAALGGNMGSQVYPMGLIELI